MINLQVSFIAVRNGLFGFEISEVSFFTNFVNHAVFPFLHFHFFSFFAAVIRLRCFTSKLNVKKLQKFCVLLDLSGLQTISFLFKGL